ncbi:unnamed protein product [Lasius platythorax]|uniref:Uncharacterized protein n=1 Tax=Lasius platythorax TaxID=488582 RepID=A0AAV2N349_9HYME
MNSLAITLCVLMEVIIAKTDRLPADTLNSNKVRAFSVPLIPASESLDSPQPSSTPIYNTDTDIQTQKNDHLNHFSHVANENGFQPEGAHLFEVPSLIKKALHYIAEHPEKNEE